MLNWPKHPSRSLHRHLGRRCRWRSKCGRYRVTSYRDTTADYYAEVRRGDAFDLLHGPLASSYRTLRRAQRECEKHARN